MVPRFAPAVLFLTALLALDARPQLQTAAQDPAPQPLMDTLQRGS